MIFKRIYDETLAQAGYLVGCAVSGEALVIDPNQDIERYLEAAESDGLRITAVTETHIHADFVSGSRELAKRTGATLYLSGEGTHPTPYAFAGDDGAVLVRDGDSFSVGKLRIDVMHTPGHTAEHLSFVLTDTSVSDRPMGVFTGDFVFVGDVGRPDLPERAVGVAGTMEPFARMLFHSLQRFKQLPDYVQIWPGHGAGSACGKGLSAMPQSTVGYERIGNWAFAIEDEDEFVRAVLAGQPEPPKYFAQAARLNRLGPEIVDRTARPQLMDVGRIAELVGQGALVIDTRRAEDFARGHLAGTINIPLDGGFPTWAGWLVPYDTDFYLIVDEPESDRLDTAVKHLRRIGLNRVAGYFSASAVRDLLASSPELQTLSQIEPAELAALLEAPDVLVIDVRGAVEWEAGHIPGARNIPVGYLPDRLAELPKDRTIVVHCLGGARSAIAASVLQAHGFEHVRDLAGGYKRWTAEGHPVERTQPKRLAA